MCKFRTYILYKVASGNAYCSPHRKPKEPLTCVKKLWFLAACLADPSAISDNGIRTFLCVFLSKLYLGSLAPRVLISEGGGMWWVYLRLNFLLSGSLESLLAMVCVSLTTLSRSSSLFSSRSLLSPRSSRTISFFRLRPRLPGFFGPFSRLLWPPGGRPTLPGTFFPKIWAAMKCIFSCITQFSIWG